MTKTADEMALEIMLSDAPDEVRQARLDKLLKTVGNVFCPECAAPDECIQDNGEVGQHRVFLCTRCDHQWGPGTEV